MNEKSGKIQELSLKYFPLAWAAVLLTSFTARVLFKIFGIDYSTLVSSLNLSSPWTLGLIFYDTFQLIVVIFLLYSLKKKEKVSFKELGFRKTDLKYYLFALVPLLAVQFIWDASKFIVNQFGMQMLWHGGEDVAPIKTLSDLLILFIFPVFFCSPLEEILYRGYLLTALMQRLDTKVAVIINSLIFASIHYSYGPGTMLFIFFWNFIPCWLYFKSKSIYPGILFHSTNNLIAYVVLPLLGM